MARTKMAKVEPTNNRKIIALTVKSLLTQYTLPTPLEQSILGNKKAKTQLGFSFYYALKACGDNEKLSWLTFCIMVTTVYFDLFFDIMFFHLFSNRFFDNFFDRFMA